MSARVHSRLLTAAVPLFCLLAMCRMQAEERHSAGTSKFADEYVALRLRFNPLLAAELGLPLQPHPHLADARPERFAS
jgi:hypothetical protein